MRSISTFVLACILLCSYSYGQDLVLNLNDGSTIEYSVNTIQKLSYGDDNLLVHLTSENVKLYELDSIKKITHKKSDPSGTSAPGKINVKVFPNPTSEFVTIRLIEPNTSNHKVELMNSKAQLLRSQNLQLAMGNELTMSISSLPSGVYYLRITENTNQIITKIIKP